MNEKDASGLIDVMRDLVRMSRIVTARQGRVDDVPPAVLQVLDHLDATGEQRLGGLAVGLGVDLSVASRHAAAAEDSGLLVRRPDPVDRRACLLSVTDAGARTLRANRQQRLRWLLDATPGWTGTDGHELLTLLTKLRDDISGAGLRPVRTA